MSEVEASAQFLLVMERKTVPVKCVIYKGTFSPSEGNKLGTYLKAFLHNFKIPFHITTKAHVY